MGTQELLGVTQSSIISTAVVIIQLYTVIKNSYKYTALKCTRNLSQLGKVINADTDTEMIIRKEDI